MRSLRNISMVEATIKEPVVANNATASTVAFIAPGPPNPPITQVSPPSLSSSHRCAPPSNSSLLLFSFPPPLLAAPPHFPSLGSGQLSIERWAIAARAHPTPDLPTVTQTYGTHAPSRPPTVPSLCHLDLGTWAPGPIPSLRPISHHPTPRL